MSIQEKKIDIAGPLNAATAEGLLADARQIWLHLTDDTLDKSVIGRMEWPNLYDEELAAQGKPFICEVVRDGDRIGILLNTYSDGKCHQMLITSYSLVGTELVKEKGQLFIYYRINDIDISVSPTGKPQGTIGNWQLLAGGGEILTLKSNIGIEEYPIFDDTASYVIGKVVRYTDGKLYRFTTPHTAGAWNTSEVEPWNIVRDSMNNMIDLQNEINHIKELEHVEKYDIESPLMVIKDDDNKILLEITKNLISIFLSLKLPKDTIIDGLNNSILQTFEHMESKLKNLDFLNEIFYNVSTEFIKVILDQDNKVIETIDFKGITRHYSKHIFEDDLKLKENDICIIDSDEYRLLILDNDNRIIRGIDNNGNSVIDLRLNEIKQYVDEQLSDIKEQPNPNENIGIEQNLRMFNSVICCGDSVTAGHIYWNNSSVAVMSQYSYPNQLSKMFPEMSFENAGQAGQTIKGWCTVNFLKYDFNAYDVAIIELGYNSKVLSDTYDIDVAPYKNYEEYADTEFAYYCRLIEQIKEQNPWIFICLIISRAFSNTKRAAILRIAKEYNLPYIDLADIKLYPKNFEDCGINLEKPNVHASPWGYLLKASYVRDGIGRVINEYHERAVKCVLARNDRIWRITAEIDSGEEINLAEITPSYQEVIQTYEGKFTCKLLQSKARFEGWYYNDELLSSELTYTFNANNHAFSKLKKPFAFTIKAKISL